MLNMFTYLIMAALLVIFLVLAITALVVRQKLDDEIKEEFH